MTRQIFLWVALLWFGASAVLAQNDPTTMIRDAQERGKAIRAARADALRQLAESVQGVRISSTTTVKDFVTESDRIQASFDEMLLKGVDQVGEPRFSPDGICEVTLNLSLDRLILGLQEICGTHGSRKLDARQIEQMRHTSGSRVFTATGSGAMATAAVVPAIQADFWNHVTPQGKLMAQRAAQVDAYRNLGEAIQGVRISSSTTVQDFVAVSDEIRLAFNGFVRGVQFVGEPRYKAEGICEVTAEVNLSDLNSFLSSACRQHYCGDRWNAQSFQEMSRYGSGVIRATGAGVPPARYVRVYPSPFPNPPTPVPTYPDWANRTLQATGSGQSRDAAEMEAYRRISQQVLTLKIDARTDIQDFVNQNSACAGQISNFIRGARITAERVNQWNRSVEVDMELELRPLWQIISNQRGY